MGYLICVVNVYFLIIRGGIRFYSLGSGSAGGSRGGLAGRGVLMEMFSLEGHSLSVVIVLVVVYSISDVSFRFWGPWYWSRLYFLYPLCISLWWGGWLG